MCHFKNTIYVAHIKSHMGKPPPHIWMGKRYSDLNLLYNIANFFD